MGSVLQREKNNFSSSILLAALGFSFFWPSHRLVVIKPLLSLFGEYSGDQPSLLFLLILVHELIVVLILILSRKHIEHFFCSLRVVLLASAVGFVGFLFVSLIPWLDNQTILLLPAFFVALYSGVMLISWCMLFARYTPSQISFALALAAAFSSLEFVIANSQTSSAVLSLLRPVVSGILFALAIKDTKPLTESVNFSVGGLSKEIPLRAVIISTFIILVVPTFLHLAEGATGGVGLDIGQRMATYYSTLVIFAVLAVCFACNPFSKKILSVYFYFFVVLFFCALTAVELFYLHNGTLAVLGILRACSLCLEIYLLILLIIDVNQNRRSALLLLGILCIVGQILPDLCGSLLGGVLFDAYFSSQPDVLVVVVSILVCTIAVLSIGLFATERLKLESDDKRKNNVELQCDSSSRPSLAESSFYGDTRIAEICLQASTGKQLTEREQQLLYVYYQGNSMRKAAEILGVSIATVQSHSQNLYRKMQIHTKQELIDLVNKSRDAAAPVNL